MSKNWYPIINKKTCAECGKCVNKCAHGVYDKGSPKKPFVVFTSGCIDKCHGCGELCPTGSITYAGDDTGWASPSAGKTKRAESENNDNKGAKTMKTMQIYEPAMCCPTGLCGVSIDPELLRISTVLDTLKKNGIEVKRYNLTSFPQEFVKNTKINERLTDEGVETLPITVVDGKIIITKRYPRNDEFIKLLGLPGDFLGETGQAAESCGCGEVCC